MALITPVIFFTDSVLGPLSLILDKEQTETVKKDTNVTILPFTLQEEEATEIFGTTGSTMVITIQGSLIGPLDQTGINKLSDQLANALLFAKANPTEAQNFTYRSNLFPTGQDCAVLSMQFTLSDKVQSKLDYVIKLVVGEARGS